MPSFGKASLAQRATLHPDLQKVLDEAIKTFDFSIQCGFRNKQDQNIAFTNKASKVQWPNSRHNVQFFNEETQEWEPESQAADCLPYPFKKEDWKDLSRFARMMGHLESAAVRLGIPVELGMDWDMDQSTIDESFRDYPHIQLKRPVRKV